MINTSNKKECTGCGVCMNACPKQAIKMEPDSEGFLFPVVNIDLCVNCNICINVCQINNISIISEETTHYYAAINKNKELLLQSSSGGVFSSLADFITKKNGIIVGCIFDSNMKAIHIAVESKDGYSQFQGSKYVQSVCEDIYLNTKKHLDEGRWVLFTGTPCQVAGLKLYLKKDYPLLLTADLICHGVTSPGLWAMNVRNIEYKEKSQIEDYKFRDKIYRSRFSLYYYYYYCKGKKKANHGIPEVDAYFSTFLQGSAYRESCYNCKYANLHRVGDFTIGDYWGVEDFHPDIDKSNGVSLMLVNSQKANDILPELSQTLKLIPTNKDWCTEKNKNLLSPTPRPNIRDTIYYSIYSKGYSKWEKEFKHSKKYILLKVKLLIPLNVKKFLKRLIKKI